MKKVLFIALFLCVCTMVQAQSYAGGTLGYALEDVVYSKRSHVTHSLVIAPEAGYNFNNHWALGVTLPIECLDLSEDATTMISLMPYLRGTFARAGKVDFFAEFTLGYGWAIGDGDAMGLFQAGLRPGFLVNITDRFGLVFRTTLLGFSNYHQDGMDSTNVLDFSIGNNFAAGVQFSF